MTSARRRARVRVHGRVQGVGFRYATLQQGRALGLRGWVRNLADGTVEALVEGRSGNVESFLEWCAHGPAGARVTSVTTSEEARSGQLGEMEIRG